MTFNIASCSAVSLNIQENLKIQFVEFLNNQSHFLLNVVTLWCTRLFFPKFSNIFLDVDKYFIILLSQCLVSIFYYYSSVLPFWSFILGNWQNWT